MENSPKNNGLSGIVEINFVANAKQRRVLAYWHSSPAYEVNQGSPARSDPALQLLRMNLSVGYTPL